MGREIFVGTAGWSIPGAAAGAFPAEGSGLARYATRFMAAEINTTFYRRHRASTFARWRLTVPAGFRFAVKMPRAITHEARLASPEAALATFFDDIGPLEETLGPILVQLPPSLAHEPTRDAAFFRAMRARHAGPVACEPRHPTWFSPEAEALLAEHEVARVAADPARPTGADRPAGARSLLYLRLHGSPVMYHSPYGPARLAETAARLEAATAALVFCIFDNTASGAAIADALTLGTILSDADSVVEHAASGSP